MADVTGADGFCGNWSTVECTGFVELMTAMGVGMIKRNLASAAGAGSGMKNSIVKGDGPNFTIQITAPKAGAVNPFSMAGTTEIVTGQGDKGDATCKLDGGKLVVEVVMKDGSNAGKTMVLERELTDAGMTFTVYFSHVPDAKCVRKMVKE